MPAVLDVVAVLALVVLVGVVVFAFLSGRRGSGTDAAELERASTVPDDHQHRWTRWQTVDERRIHLYGEVDEGRELPDRIDVVLRRECAICGLPQTRTVRGLDPDIRT